MPISPKNKEKKKTGLDKFLPFILVVLTIFIIFQNSYDNSNAQKTLSLIYVYLVSEPKTYLQSEVSCKVIDAGSASSLFEKKIEGNSYIDEITIKAQSKLASDINFRIELPENLEYMYVASSPKTNFTIKNENKFNYNTQKTETYKIISAIWSIKLIPEDSVKVFILYNQNEKDSLKQITRQFSYGSGETGQYTNTINCNNGFEIFKN